MTCAVRPMAAGDIPLFVAAFGADDPNKTPALFDRYLDGHDAGRLVALTAVLDGAVAGYVTLLWTSRYPPFARDGIPEIVDLNVVPEHRRRGAGDALVAACEDAAREAGRTTIGLGVGLYTDYGSAQRLYVRRGYLPDGAGVLHEWSPVAPGSTLRLDDDAVLAMTKPLG